MPFAVYFQLFKSQLRYWWLRNVVHRDKVVTITFDRKEYRKGETLYGWNDEYFLYLGADKFLPINVRGITFNGCATHHLPVLGDDLSIKEAAYTPSSEMAEGLVRKSFILNMQIEKALKIK